MSRLARYVLIPLALGACWFSATSGVASAAGEQSPLRTRVVVVSPVDKGGELAKGYSVEKIASGYCNNTSLLNAGPRCFVTGHPEPFTAAVRSTTDFMLCWALVDRKTAACVQSPWSKRVVEVRTLGLPPALPPIALRDNLAFPIAVQLMSGVRCAASGGASDLFNHEIVRFGCPGTKMSLLEPITQSPPYWSFQSVMASKTGTGYTKGPVVYVKTAYYALGGR